MHWLWYALAMHDGYEYWQLGNAGYDSKAMVFDSIMEGGYGVETTI